MEYTEPKGKIINSCEKNNISTLVIEFNKMDPGPPAPAGLYKNPKSGNEHFQLHRVVYIDGLTYTFETFNRSHPLPMTGEIYSYRGWWLPDAMKAVLDTDEKWEKRTYPDNGDHEHCLFSWKAIASYTDDNEAYFSKKYGWITQESYNNFIVRDIYKIRCDIAHNESGQLIFRTLHCLISLH